MTNIILFQGEDGYWSKTGYDKYGNVVFLENSNGHWFKKKFDSRGNLIYSETPSGKYEARYDKKNRRIYYKSGNHWIKTRYARNGKIVFQENENGISIQHGIRYVPMSKVRELLQEEYGDDLPIIIK